MKTMKHRSGWYRGKRTKWHWFDNDAEWSVCGSLRYTTKLLLVAVSPEGWGLPTDCHHCEKMVRGKPRHD